MTIAEIALWSKKTPGVLNTDEKYRRAGKLVIVPMIGWNREMTWPKTGLVWYPTSPNIPTLDSVAGYPMTGLGAQLGKFKHGIGTNYPFRFLTYEGKSAQEIKETLESFDIPGTGFNIKKIKTNEGQEITGVYISITDWNKWAPTDLPFYMMKLTALWETPNPFTKATESEVTLFNKHVGSLAWWKDLESKGSQVDIDKFLTDWKKKSDTFRKEIKTYHLY